MQHVKSFPDKLLADPTVLAFQTIIVLFSDDYDQAIQRQGKARSMSNVDTEEESSVTRTVKPPQHYRGDSESDTADNGKMAASFRP